MLSEIRYEIQRGFRQTRKSIEDIVARAETNRRLLPSHPLYKRQFKRDITYGLVATGISLSALIPTTIYALGWESRSAERAAKSCASIICAEESPAVLSSYGLDPEQIEEQIRRFPHPSFAEVKSWNDTANRFSDFAPIAGAGSMNIAALSASLGFLFARTRRHMKRIKHP